MGLESVTEKAVQGRAKALQHEPTQSGVYTAVSRESLVREKEEETKAGEAEVEDQRRERKT